MREIFLAGKEANERSPAQSAVIMTTMAFWVLLVISLALAVGLGVLAARSFIAASGADDTTRKHR